MVDNVPPVVHADLRYDKVSVSDTTAGEMRSVFIRLVPRGQGYPADTIAAADCQVDIDDDGRVIGVTMTWDV